MFDLTQMFREILTEQTTASIDRILKALRGKNLCAITYESSVPDYPVADGTRWAVILAFGVGRFQGEKCIRVYQPYGDESGYGSKYKIMYIKDITKLVITPQIQKTPPELFNPTEDRWMVQTIEVAKWKGFTSGETEPIVTKEPEVFKTDTERRMDKLKQQVQRPTYTGVKDHSKTTQERYKEVKNIANQALSLYNRAKREGDQIAADRALKSFRDSQRLANQYMAIYKKGQNNR